MPININNDLCFSYDTQSGLESEDFDNINTLTSLKIRFGDPVLRKNGNTYYTIYSLSGNRLCYVFLFPSPNTGVNFYINDIQIVSVDDGEKTFYSLLLTHDLPNQIFNNQCE